MQKGFFSQLGASPLIQSQISQMQKQNQSNAYQQQRGQDRKNSMSKSHSQSNIKNTPQFSQQQIQEDLMKKSIREQLFVQQQQQQQQEIDTFDPYESASDEQIDINVPASTHSLNGQQQQLLLVQENEENENQSLKITLKESDEELTFKAKNPQFSQAPQTKESNKLQKSDKKKVQSSSKKRTNKIQTSQERSISKKKIPQIQKETNQILQPQIIESQNVNMLKDQMRPSKIATSRNKQFQNLQQQNTHQSSFCNIASVKNKESIIQFNENDDNIKQLREAKLQVQRIEDEFHKYRSKAKQEKLQTMQELGKIQENYKKYAYYYSKYLEDKVKYSEFLKEYEQIKNQNVELQDKQTKLVNLLLDLLEKMMQNQKQNHISQQFSESLESMQQMIVTKIIELKLNQDYNPPSEQQNHQEIDQIKHSQSQNSLTNQCEIQSQATQRQIGQENILKGPPLASLSSSSSNKTVFACAIKTQLSQNPIQSVAAHQQQNQLFGDQSYQTIQRQHSANNLQKSDHKRARSSTPKTQFRYQEQVDEDDDLYQVSSSHLQQYNNENEQKREQAQRVFKQSITSPSNFDNIDNNGIGQQLRVVQQSKDQQQFSLLAASSYSDNKIKNSAINQREKHLSIATANTDQGHLTENNCDQDTFCINNNYTNTNNVYEYTLKSIQLNESERQQQTTQKHKQGQNSISQNAMYFGDLIGTPQTVINHQESISDQGIDYGDSFCMNNNSKKQQDYSCGVGSRVLAGPEFQVSKLDTFSPRQYQEIAQQQQQQQMAIKDSSNKRTSEFFNNQYKEFNYSIEFPNNESANNNNSQNNPQNYYQDNQIQSPPHTDQIQHNSIHSQENSILTQESDRKIEIGVAIKSFNGSKEQDLNFKVGEKILIESKVKGSNWIYGSIGMRKGWFPSACVRVEEHFI